MIELETAPAVSTERPRMRGTDWSLIVLLAAVNFTHLVDFVIIMPLGARLMHELDITPVEFSRLVSGYGIAAGLMSLAASSFVDRFDRKYVLLLGYAGFTASTLFCALAPNYEWLMAARITAGAFGGLTAGAITAVIGDVFPPSLRGTATGAVMSAFAVASIVGLPAGLTLANHFGRQAPFYALAALSAAVWIFVAIRLPNVRRHLEGGHAAEARHALVIVIENPRQMLALAFSVAMVCGTFVIIPFIGPYMMLNVGRSEENLPWIYMVSGVCTLVSLNVIGRLTDRIGARTMFQILASCALIMTLVITNLPPVSLGISCLLTALFMVSASGRMVPAQATLIGCAKPQERGAFLSLNNACQQFAVGSAPMIGGWLVSKGTNGQLIGYSNVGLIGVIFTLSSIVLFRLLRPAVET